MDGRKFESKKRYLVAFIIGTIVFLLVFIISYSLSYLELARVSNQQSDSGYEIFEDKLMYSFFNEQICSGVFLGKLTEDLAFQGRIIDDLERKLGKDDQGVLNRKKFYSLVELEHFEFVRILNEKCNGNIDTILFFYSNNDSNLDASEETGRIIGVVHNRNSNLVIYSFDIDLNSEIVNKLELKYNITSSPTIIINEKDKIEKPRNILEIESKL